MALDSTNVLSRLAGPVAVASGTSTIYTGAVSHIYTVKKIRIVNTDTVNSITIKLGIGGVAAGNMILPVITIDAGAMLDDDCFIVLSGAETLQANTSATGLTISVFGLDQS